MKNILEHYFGLIRTLLPQRDQGSSVGLDVGAGECKMVELLSLSAEHFSLLSYGVEPVVGGDVNAALQTLVSKITREKYAIYSSVSGRGTLIRQIDMPRMGLEEMRSAFSIEADKYFPFPQDQIYTDCHILEENPDKKTMKIIAGAAKKEMVDEHVQLLSSAGLETRYIGLNPIALANVFSTLESGNEQESAAVAILDLGDKTSNLSIVIHGKPRFTRDIFKGGRDITKALSNALNISFSEADALKKNPLESKKAIEFSQTCLANIVQEVRLSFDYFSTEHGVSIQKLLIVGGGAALENLDAYFQESLEVTVERWNPFKRLRVSADLQSEDLEKQSIKLGVALGLAMADYDYS